MRDGKNVSKTGRLRTGVLLSERCNNIVNVKVLKELSKNEIRLIYVDKINVEKPYLVHLLQFEEQCVWKYMYYWSCGQAIITFYTAHALAYMYGLL